MKSIVVAAFFFLAGCSSFVSLEQLEAEALVSGDWSQVEQRERLIERRKLRSFLACPPGSIGYCEADAGAERCSCVDADTMSAYLGGGR